MDAADPIPFRDRKRDWFFVGFFALNFFYISPLVDLEQLIIADPNNFEPPLFPPLWSIELTHWWGRTFDPLLLARPPFWQMTIWLDILFFWPFYGFAIYAYVKGKAWIRVPTIVWAATIMTNVLLILSEEWMGIHATPYPLLVTAVNGPWFLIPALAIARMWKDGPFLPTANSTV